MFGWKMPLRLPIGSRSRYELRSSMPAGTFFATLASLTTSDVFGLVPVRSSKPVTAFLKPDHFELYRNGVIQASRLIGTRQSGSESLKTTLTVELGSNVKSIIIVFFVLSTIAIAGFIQEVYIEFTSTTTDRPSAILFIYVFLIALLVVSQWMMKRRAKREQREMLDFLVDLSGGEVLQVADGPWWKA